MTVDTVRGGAVYKNVLVPVSVLDTPTGELYLSFFIRVDCFLIGARPEHWMMAHPSS